MYILLRLLTFHWSGCTCLTEYIRTGYDEFFQVFHTARQLKISDKDLTKGRYVKTDEFAKEFLTVNLKTKVLYIYIYVLYQWSLMQVAWFLLFH